MSPIPLRSPYNALTSLLINAMAPIEGRPYRRYPKSESDMQACVLALLSKFEFMPRCAPLTLEEMAGAGSDGRVIPEAQLRPQPSDVRLAPSLLAAMRIGLDDWRSDLNYPLSHSDMQDCVHAVLARFEVQPRAAPFRREDMAWPPAVYAEVAHAAKHSPTPAAPARHCTPGDGTPPSADDLDVPIPAASTESPATALVRTRGTTLGVAREHPCADAAADHAEADDEVIGVRAWGTSWLVPLPTLGTSRVLTTTALPEVGAVTTTALQRAREALAMLSHGLVVVVRDGRRWRIRDSDGRAQLKQDGRLTRQASLMPGTEIQLAGLTLIAESARSIALRNLCARLLGWSDSQVENVDQALRAIRLAASGRSALVLRGSGDLVPVARTIHRRTLGDCAPFVVSDPRRRRTTRATVRNADNVELGLEAFRQASHGTLCVRGLRPPPDFDEVLRLFREPHSSVRLTVCIETAVSRRDTFALAPARIEIPSLETRRDELPRIAHEYLVDAIDALRAPAACLDTDAIQWVLDHSARSANVTLSDIEKAAVRTVALRVTTGVWSAARLLGMAPVSLQRWLSRRQ